MKKILCNKYEVLKPIAEGGMGSVLLVKDLHLNKLAAVKVSKIASGTEARNSMLQEREVLKQLSHPALPQIIDFFEDGGNDCLVMEYVEGITLEQYLRRFGTVELAQAVKWAVELTEVLHYLHQQNPPVIYRDLKPANIMVRPDGKLKLIDFGTAVVSAFGHKKEDVLMGTPGYSAPEQWKGGNAGKESDIYALGAVLHEMLTGMRPMQTLVERRPVREYDRSIPAELEKIIMICTKKLPRDRYQSMEKVKEALLSYKKKRIGWRIAYGVQKGIGILLWSAAGIRTFVPLLRGVREDQFPFPFLIEPLVLFSMVFLYQLIFVKRKARSRFLKKQEKSIFLTEKKFAGWYMKGSFALLLLLISASITQTTLSAGMGKELWVEMRDAQNRKLLLKNGAVYQPGERVRFDIPCEELPKGVLSMQIVAVSEGGEIFESRVFLVEGN